MRPHSSFLKYSFCLLLCLVLFSRRGASQSFTQQFDALFLKENPDTTQIKTLLRLWQRMSPEDPQLYISAYNYYFSQSRDKVPMIATAAPETADSSAAPIRLVTEVEYNPRRVAAALAWINEGISRFPDRLDMWLGKTHALRLTHSFDSFQVVMQRILDRSVDNRNQWYWSDGRKLDSGRQFLLSTMRTYLRELYGTGRDELLPVMSRLGEAIIKVYPEEVEILSMTAVSLIGQQQYAHAIAYLKRAERVRPKDVIVLNNLAEAHRLMGDKDAARQYLQLIESYGNAGERAAARKQRKALRRS